jgi:ferredoxin
MRVLLDRTKCVGAGQCVMSAPAAFDQDPESGLSILLLEKIPDEFREAVRKAELLCPSRSITVVEE